jgi:mannose-6-phosphate isomerase-like protein (cupin superfamily)
LEKTVREESLGSLSLAEIVTTLGLSKRGFHELFMARPNYLDRSFDQALFHASSTIARTYRRRAKGGPGRQMRKLVELMLEPEDEHPQVSRAFCSLLPEPDPTVRLGLWQLPGATADGPYRHHLSAAELLVVIAGGPTLHTDGEFRDLHADQAAVVPRARDGELLNYTPEPVHFLALSSVPSSQLQAEPSAPTRGPNPACGSNPGPPS